MGVTPMLLLLLALSAPDFVDEPVIIENDCVGADCLAPDTDSTPPDPAELNYDLNETFTHDAFEYTFTNAYYADPVEVLDEGTVEYFGEPDNFLVIEFEYTNVNSTEDTPRNYLSLYADGYVIEEYGRSHTIPSADPGKNAQGQLLFDVPDGVERLEIEVDSYDYKTYGRAIVNIDVSE